MSLFRKYPSRYPILRTIEPSQDVKVFDQNGELLRVDAPQSFQEIMKIENQKRKEDAINNKAKGGTL